MNTQHSPHSNRSNADRWLKAIGAIVVLWAAAKIIGSILTPGMVLLAIALWLIVRANKKRKAQPQLQFVPAQSNQFTSPDYFAAQPVYPQAMYPQPVSQPPRGYWMPTAANPAGRPTQMPVMQAPIVPTHIVDTRTAAEREIEDYVEQAWPHVKAQQPKI
jgi:hypothetical protein